MREEQQQHQEQLVKFLVQSQEEVRNIEKLQQNQAGEDQMTLGAVGGAEEPKSFKPLTPSPFSGANPAPKGEASYEQWLWQAKEALKSCMTVAMRIAIMQSIRGKVREFATAVGFKASVEVLLEKIEDHFREKWTADGLQQDFYKITQGKNEKVRQFVGSSV